MKLLKIIVLAMLLVVLAGVVTLVTWPARIGRGIDSRIAAIKAKGDPVCGKDLIPKPVPDAENGAVIYERIFAMIEPAKADIDKANDVSSPLKLKGHPEILDSARKLATKYRSILPLLEQASARPKCRFNTNWNDPPEKILLPYHAKIRGVSRLLSEVAIADASEGRMDDAVRAIGSGYRLGECLKKEPTIMGCLSRFSCIAVNSRALKVSAQYGDIVEPQAHSLFNLIGTINLRPGYVYAFKGERAQGLDFMERLRAYHPWPLNLGHCRDELFYIKYMDLAVSSDDQPYGKTNKHDRVPEIPKYATYSDSLIPVFAGCHRKLYEAMSTLAGDRNFLGVLAYRSKFGRYPSDLAEVEKKLGWKLPHDPLGDAPFHYRREGKGFVLYGVGKNMKDDHGVAVQDLSKTVHDPDKRSALLGKHPYTNGDGRRSADMIWAKDK